MDPMYTIIGNNHGTEFYYFPDTKNPSDIVSSLNKIDGSALAFVHSLNKQKLEIKKSSIRESTIVRGTTGRLVKRCFKHKIVYLLINYSEYHHILRYLERLPENKFNEYAHQGMVSIEPGEIISFYETNCRICKLDEEHVEISEPLMEISACQIENLDEISKIPQISDSQTKLNEIMKKNSKEWAARKIDHLISSATETTSLLYGSTFRLHEGPQHVVEYAKSLLAEHVDSDKLIITGDGECTLEYLF